MALNGVGGSLRIPLGSGFGGPLLTRGGYPAFGVGALAWYLAAAVLV